MGNPELRSSRCYFAIAVAAFSCVLLRPADGAAAVTFTWVPSDGSSSSGSLTVDVPAAGRFSVSSTNITALDFTFRPGLSVHLVPPARDGGIPLISFDGSGLDYGAVANSFPADAVFGFSSEQLGADVATYLRGQIVRVSGQWMRLDIVPPAKPPLRIGLLGVLDTRPLMARHDIGNMSGIAYNAAADVIYVSHGSDPRGAFIYTLDSSGDLLREVNLQAVYRPGVYPSSLSYDDATGHLFVELPGNPQTTIIEMSPDGSRIFREISFPSPVGGGYSMVRADGIWQPQFALDTIRHYTSDGQFVEEISIGASFPSGFPGPEALTSAIDDPGGGFLVVDHFGRRLVQVEGNGREVAAVTTDTLGDRVTGEGRGMAVATDPPTKRIFLLGDGKIFVLSSDYMRTRVVNDLLRLADEPIVKWDRTPVPRGNAGTFRLTATFANTSDLDACGLFFLVNVSQTGSRIHQFDSVALEPSGELLQGYDQMTTGHRPIDLPAHAAITVTFTIDLQSRTWFDFFADAWAVPLTPALRCGRSG